MHISSAVMAVTLLRHIVPGGEAETG